MAPSFAEKGHHTHLSWDPPGRVLDGGKLAMGMSAARRVRPVVIRNDKQWRARLMGDLTVWRTAVETEFAGLRARQDKNWRSFQNDSWNPS